MTIPRAEIWNLPNKVKKGYLHRQEFRPKLSNIGVGNSIWSQIENLGDKYIFQLSGCGLEPQFNRHTHNEKSNRIKAEFIYKVPQCHLMYDNSGAGPNYIYGTKM